MFGYFVLTFLMRAFRKSIWSNILIFNIFSYTFFAYQLPTLLYVIQFVDIVGRVKLILTERTLHDLRVVLLYYFVFLLLHGHFVLLLFHSHLWLLVHTHRFLLNKQLHFHFVLFKRFYDIYFVFDGRLELFLAEFHNRG